ncbi:STAS domain-containing protein [Streptomyces sp. cmx-4-9]|uniref:STAS domain-containing protein n=1 Tax=Streptomyces sp. cmx-4-9 TaxID=2790941 RepID=UPI00397F3057
MNDTETAKIIAAQIAAYLAAVKPAEPNPDDLAWAVLHALKQAGLHGYALNGKGEDVRQSGEQQVLVLPDRDDGTRVIVCAGEFDQQSLDAITEAGAAATADPAIGRIVLDVSRITFADSSMLNAMFRLRRASTLVLVGPLPRSLERVLQLTQARTLFDVAEDIDTARTL